MIEVNDYYKNIHKTAANSNEFELFEQDFTPFPRSGVYIGTYSTSAGYKAPALIPIDQTNGICFLSNSGNADFVKQSMQIFLLRLAMSLPAGLCRMTLYDATGQGAGLINLSNLHSRIKGDNILCNINDLRQELQNAQNEIPNVIQKVLGARFANKTLMDYNENAEELAKPYHFIVLTDVPKTLNKETFELLQQVIKTGRRAGVFVIMNLDTSFIPSQENKFDLRLILDTMTTIYQADKHCWYIHNLPNEKFLNEKFILDLEDRFPSYETLDDIQNFINDNLNKAQNVQISLADKLTEKVFWTKDASNGIETPIGKVSSSQVLNFALSVESGTGQSYHHCLIGGATGSGKTVLLHNIICNTAWLYSPEEVQFLLLDFKEGTEFKIYENLPHVKVLSMRSEIEFAKNVFDFIEEEFERRGKLFKEAEVQNINKYKLTGQKLPRYIIIIDEFQKLFDGDMKSISYFENQITDIGKRGRSFGIHAILSTQGLGGIQVGHALTEFGLRISMRLNNDMECSRILGNNNMAPRTLTKKGESVYCPGGLANNNIIYQVAYMKDEKIKSVISKMQNEYELRKDDMHDFTRYIFDGEAPVYITDNPAVKQIIHSENHLKVYIGSPVSLTVEHTSYTLTKENGNNVLMIGQDVGGAMSIIYHSIKQILAQSDTNTRIIVANKISQGNEFVNALQPLGEKFDKQVEICANYNDINKHIEQLNDEIKIRKAEYRNSPNTILVLANIYNLRECRQKASMESPLSKQMAQIFQDGPECGIHVISYFDTYQHYNAVFQYSKIALECNFKIELRGGDGFMIFGNNTQSKSSISLPFTANLSTWEMEDGQQEKIKIYQLK